MITLHGLELQNLKVAVFSASRACVNGVCI